MKKTALITGGSRGIGLGIAKRLAYDGYNLAINGIRDESRVGEILDELRETGTEVIYCRGDIASKKARVGIVDRIREHYKRLDVLVNNAGVAPQERKDILGYLDTGLSV